jgi:hypothetical protein
MKKKAKKAKWRRKAKKAMLVILPVAAWLIPSPLK